MSRLFLSRLFLSRLFLSKLRMETPGQGADGKRGLVLSRFGGLGTHRYGVGFSGDAPQSYHTLQMQVAMTAQASNVLFGYWSHDIGGFHNGTVIKGFAKGYPYMGDEDPSNATQSELYLRWLQFGTFSPIFRTLARRSLFHRAISASHDTMHTAWDVSGAYGNSSTTFR
jgi:alpha-glucosidase (family GH31 glycosyl hydrolase)